MELSPETRTSELGQIYGFARAIENRLLRIYNLPENPQGYSHISRNQFDLTARFSGVIPEVIGNNLHLEIRIDKKTTRILSQASSLYDLLLNKKSRLALLILIEEVGHYVDLQSHFLRFGTVEDGFRTVTEGMVLLSQKKVLESLESDPLDNKARKGLDIAKRKVDEEITLRKNLHPEDDPKKRYKIGVELFEGLLDNIQNLPHDILKNLQLMSMSELLEFIVSNYTFLIQQTSGEITQLDLPILRRVRRNKLAELRKTQEKYQNNRNAVLVFRYNLENKQGN